jgi:hypothetical protein
LSIRDAVVVTRVAVDAFLLGQGNTLFIRRWGEVYDLPFHHAVGGRNAAAWDQGVQRRRETIGVQFVRHSVTVIVNIISTTGMAKRPLDIRSAWRDVAARSSPVAGADLYSTSLAGADTH